MCALRLPTPTPSPAAPSPAAAGSHLEIPHAYVGWSTYPAEADAEKAARTLIDDRIAACVQIDGPIRSFYRWEGRTKEDREWRLTVKFTHENRDAVSRIIRETHPYETAQWLVIKVDHASPAYLAWMNGY